MNDPFEIFFNSIILIGLIFLVSIFFYQTQKKNRKSFFLMMGLIFAGIGQFIFILAMIVDQSQITLEKGKYIRDFLFGCMYYSLFVHYQSLRSDRPNVLIGNIFAIILAMTGSLTCLFFFYPTEPLIRELTKSLINLIGLFTFTYIFYATATTFLLIKEKESAAECFFIFIVFFAHIIYVLGDNGLLAILDSVGTYELFADIGGIIGIYGIFMIYLLNVDYLYRLPVPVHQIIIYNQAGVPAYSRRVYTQGVESPEIQELLFAGMITAISSLMIESLGPKAKLQYIDASDKHIFFESKESISIVVIADRGTKVLLKSLRVFNSLISKDLCNKLNRPAVNTEEHKVELDNLLMSSFPYIRIINK